MTRHLRRYLYLEALAEQGDGWEPPNLSGALEATWGRLGQREVAWLRRRPTPTSGSAFEDDARHRKARAIAASVPREVGADRLVKMGQGERVRLAARAGCRAPSAETWRLVVAEVRER